MKPIGVFDSGVGGLTVVKELIRQLPLEDIVYFGDTARVPYGTKSQETIIRFSLENILFLLRQEVKLIVVACNTSSSIALPTLKRHFKIPIIGVITPGVKEAILSTKNKRVGIIATRATINSGAYKNEIKRIDSSISVFSQTCPLFVPLAEEGWIKNKIALDIVAKYLLPLKRARIDTLILGCTHYPLLKTLIKKVMGDGIRLIDSAQQVAAEVKQILEGECLCSSSRNGRPRYFFWVSDEPNKFKQLAKRFLSYPLKNVKRVNEDTTYGVK